MIGGGEPPEERSPAERGLDRHLELLRRLDSEEPGRSLVQTVVRTARWQRAARAPLRVAGMIAGALFDGVLRQVAMGGRRRR